MALVRSNQPINLLLQDLTDRKYKAEGTIRELKAKLSSLEEEHQRARQELQVLRRDNARLDSGHHEHEKCINQMHTRIAVLEQEVKDKEELLEKTSAMCQSEQEQKVKLVLASVIIIRGDYRG